MILADTDTAEATAVTDNASQPGNTRHRSAGALLSLLAAASIIGIAGVSIAADGTPGVLWEGDSFQVFCRDRSPDLCGTGDGDSLSEAAMEAGRTIGETAEMARDWFQDLEFPDRIRIDTHDGLRRLYYADDSLVPADCRGENACYSGMARTLYILDRAVQGSRLPRTIAHELSHAAVSIHKNQALDWLDEAMATAVGLAFADPPSVGWRRYPPPYLLDLDLPFHAGTEGGYEKALYLLYLGEQLGSTDNVGYLRTFYDNLFRGPNNHGMTLLYDGPEGELAGHAFDRIFPRFVARINNADEGYFEMPVTDEDGAVVGTQTESATLYYSDIHGWSLPPFDSQSAMTDRIDRTVAPFGADPVLVDPLDITVSPDTPPDDRLMVAEFEIDNAERPGDLSFVFEHQVVETGPYRYMLIAGNEDDFSQTAAANTAPGGMNTGPFLRVVNTGTRPDNTAEQAYRLRARIAPTEIDILNCIATGSSAPFTVQGAHWDGVDNATIEVSAGRMEGLTYIAPDYETTVTVHLSVDDPLTRIDGGLGPVSRGETRIEIGSFEVTDDACMIRMEVVGLNAVMTYTPDGDYTEYDVPGPFASYVGIDRMMFFDESERGWVNMPFMPGQMSMDPDGTSIALFQRLAPELADEMGDESVYMARMPFYLTTALEWDRVVAAAELDSAEELPQTPVPCPFGGSGCVALNIAQGLQVGRVVYDSEHRVVGIRFPDGNEAHFSYGSHDIRRPPGW